MVWVARLVTSDQLVTIMAAYKVIISTAILNCNPDSNTFMCSRPQGDHTTIVLRVPPTGQCNTSSNKVTIPVMYQMNYTATAHRNYKAE